MDHATESRLIEEGVGGANPAIENTGRGGGGSIDIDGRSSFLTLEQLSLLQKQHLLRGC